MKFGVPSAPIYLVESDVAIKVDMALLTARTLLVTSYLADLYWSGKPHPEIEPFWEYLIRCPVKVGECVA